MLRLLDLKIKIGLKSLLKYMLIIMPLIDTFNGIFLRNDSGTSYIGQIYRLMLVGVIIALLCKYISRKTIGLLAIIFSLFMFSQIAVSTKGGYAFSSVLICLKLFIPIFLLYVFWGMYRKKIVDKLYINDILTAISTITPLTILIPYIFGLGYRTYDNSAGYLGFYYATNEISFVICSCILFLLSELYDKINCRYILLLLINLMSVLLIGTKSALAVAILGVLLYLFKILFTFKRKTLRNIMTVIVVVLGLFIGYCLFFDNLSAVYNRWIYGRTTHSDKSIIFFLTSGRTGRLLVDMKSFLNSSTITFLLGQGLAAANNGGLYVEMDLFDLMFSSGIIGMLCIIFIYIGFIKKIKIDFWSYIIIAITFILSFAGGHILYGGLGGSIYAIILFYAVIKSSEKETNCALH